MKRLSLKKVAKTVSHTLTAGRDTMVVEDFGGFLGVKDALDYHKRYGLDTKNHMITEKRNVLFLSDGYKKIPSKGLPSVYLGGFAEYSGNGLIITFGSAGYSKAKSDIISEKDVETPKRLKDFYPPVMGFDFAESMGLSRDEFARIDVSKKDFIALMNLPSPKDDVPLEGKDGRSLSDILNWQNYKQAVRQLQAIQTSGSIFFAQNQKGALVWVWDGTAFIK